MTTATAMGGPSPPGLIRKLAPFETKALRDHFLRLDRNSRHCRFAAGVSDETVIAYADRALGPDAIVHGIFVEGVLRGAAELKLTGRDRGEVAITVEEPWRLSGIGTALFARMLLSARNRGIRHLDMTCLPANRAMQRLAARFDGRVRFVSGDASAAVAAPPATPLSYWREAVADGHGMAAALIEAQARFWRRQTLQA